MMAWTVKNGIDRLRNGNQQRQSSAREQRLLSFKVLCLISFFTPTQIQHLFSGPLESCCSSLLLDNGKGLRAMLLTLIGLKVSACKENVLIIILNSLSGKYTIWIRNSKENL